MTVTALPGSRRKETKERGKERENEERERLIHKTDLRRHEARDGTHLGFTGTSTGVTGSCYRLDSDGFNRFYYPYAGRVGFFKRVGASFYYHCFACYIS